ncbi:MAG: hypothetical protein QNJ69_08320 [Gammaproteobacteria bacterium]|nr:hypothetical protein [Gammaproteobacteria bacterium]
MGVDSRVDRTLDQLGKILDTELTDEQQQQLRKVIQTAMSDTVAEMSQSSSDVINLCCSADQDLAHKLNQELELAKKALITNLSSLR